MSETPESIRQKYEYAMFRENDLYLRGVVSLETMQKRLKNLQTAMENEIERCRNIEKTHKRKKRVESPYE